MTQNEKPSDGQGDPTPALPVSKSRKVMERRFFMGFMAVMTILFLAMLWPFFGAIFWAVTFSLIFHPLNRRVLRWTGNRRNLSAIITLTAVTIVGVMPLVAILISVVGQAGDLYRQIKSGHIDPAAYIENIKSAFPAVQEFFARFNIDTSSFNEHLRRLPGAVGGVVARHVVDAGQATAGLFLSLALTLYLAFFMLRDGTRLTDRLVQILPMGDSRERAVFSKFAEVTRATVKGSLVVAIVQGTLGGVIFAIMGVGWPVLWGVVMVLLSLIPVVGSGLVWGPVVIYWFATGSWVKALILLGFGTLVIGLVDNILRPVLVGRETKMPDYLVLLSTIGGIAVFGINGFIIGPLVAALFLAVWDIFSREFQDGDEPAG